VSAPKRK